MPGRYIAVGVYSGVAVKRDSTVSQASTVHVMYASDFKNQSGQY